MFARNSVSAQIAFCVVAVGVYGSLGAGLPALAQTQMPAQTQGQGTGAKTMLMEPPAPLLPATLGKMRRVSAGDVGDGLGLVDAADAVLLTENGLRRFARSEYVDGAQRGTITVYKFMDASGAVAAFDYFKKPGMRAEKLGDVALSSADEVLLRSGVNLVVERLKLDHAAEAVLNQDLIDHLPKVVGSAGIAPLLPMLLPAKGIDAESVRYALGPVGYQAMGGVLPVGVVGFDKSAEVVTAKYGGGVLTLLLYPTPQIAGEHERAIEGLKKQQGSNAALTGTVKMRREGTLVLVTTGAWPIAEAQKMVDGIHMRGEVTWNKPVPLDFNTEVRKTFTLLESIVIFCAFSALAMLVLGLFFGYGRALIRVMQGKPAASEPEFLRIDLRGDGGKKLEITDNREGK